METTQDRSSDSGECERKIVALEEKSVIGYDGGKFLKCQPNKIAAFYLDDFMFCNDSKLETVGRPSNQITLSSVSSLPSAAL